MELVKKITYHLFQGKFAAYGQFIKFALTGSFCATIEILILFGLKNTFGDAYLLTYNAIGYLVSVVINYLLSRTWVFESGKYPIKIEFLAFLALATIGLGLNQLVFYLMIQLLSTDSLHVLIAKITAIATVVIWNFFTKKHLVFKR